MTKPALFTARRRWTNALTGLAVVTVCLACLACLAPVFVPKMLAEALIPPLYPGSVLVKQWSRSENCCFLEGRTYRAPSTVEDVLAFAERHTPGFRMERDVERGTVYRNGLADRSWLSRLIAMAISADEDLPWMFAKISEDPDRPRTALITVEIVYPAP